MILYKDVLDIIYENVRQMELYDKLLKEIRDSRRETKETFHDYNMFKKNYHGITYYTNHGFVDIVYIYNYKTNILEIKKFCGTNVEEADIYSTIIKTNYFTTNIYKFFNFFHFYYNEDEWEYVSYIDSVFEN